MPETSRPDRAPTCWADCGHRGCGPATRSTGSDPAESFGRACVEHGSDRPGCEFVGCDDRASAGVEIIVGDGDVTAGRLHRPGLQLPRRPRSTPPGHRRGSGHRPVPRRRAPTRRAPNRPGSSRRRPPPAGRAAPPPAEGGLQRGAGGKRMPPQTRTAVVAELLLQRHVHRTGMCPPR